LLIAVLRRYALSQSFKTMIQNGGSRASKPPTNIGSAESIAVFEAEHTYGPERRLSDALFRDSRAARVRHAIVAPFPWRAVLFAMSRALAQRINSSNVPVDFNASDPATDPTIVEPARKLSDELRSSPQQREASPKLAEKLGAEFNQRVQYFANLEAKYSDAQQLIAKLQEECEPLKNKLEGTNIAISGS
jgi:hypothetical protein